jgi:hypothetical protein
MGSLLADILELTCQLLSDMLSASDLLEAARAPSTGMQVIVLRTAALALGMQNTRSDNCTAVRLKVSIQWQALKPLPT